MTSCPDYESHRLNAEDLFFPAGVPARRLTQDEDEAITSIANAEHSACEGVH